MSSVQSSLLAPLMAAFSFLSLPAPAAPVTLRFEGVIDRTPVGIPYASGVSYEVGDRITGDITFDPEEGQGLRLVADQPFPVTLHVNGVTLQATDYQIDTLNNANIADFPPASLIDTITLAGGGLNVQQGAGATTVDPSTSSFRLQLFGPPGVQALPAIPPAAALWNAFTLERQLIVHLGNGEGGVVGFQATVGQFSVVPEPSSQLLFALVIITAGIFSPRCSG